MTTALLRMSMCPAPFQKPKKKGGKTGPSKATCQEGAMRCFVDTFVPSPFETRSCSASPHSSTSSGGGGSPNQPARRAHGHLSSTIVPPGVVGKYEVGREVFINSSQGSGGSRSIHLSGYQSDAYMHSGYVTEGDGGFEVQVLLRATKERPANLRMTAFRDYHPCCNEELAVRKGQRVRVLYRKHDWVFCVTKHGHSGFIPFSYVRPSRKYNGYQSEPEIARVDDAYLSGYDTDMPSSSPRFPYVPATAQRARVSSQRSEVPHSYSINTGCHRVGSGSPVQTRVVDAMDAGYMSAFDGYSFSRQRQTHTGYPHNRTNPRRPHATKPAVDSFIKHYIEELVVIHDFEPKEEDEVFVSKGERVRVLNATDPQWLWVICINTGDEGFIPRSCCTLGNHPSLSTSDLQGRSIRHQSMDIPKRHYNYVRPHDHRRNMRLQAKDRFRQLQMARGQLDPASMDKEEIKRIGTKLIVLMEYEAADDDELSVEFAETLLADVLTQTGSERIWAYCPRTDSCGFIPMSMVVPPVV